MRCSGLGALERDRQILHDVAAAALGGPGHGRDTLI